MCLTDKFPFRFVIPLLFYSSTSSVSPEQWASSISTCSQQPEVLPLEPLGWIPTAMSQLRPILSTHHKLQQPHSTSLHPAPSPGSPGHWWDLPNLHKRPHCFFLSPLLALADAPSPEPSSLASMFLTSGAPRALTWAVSHGTLQERLPWP